MALFLLQHLQVGVFTPRRFKVKPPAALTAPRCHCLHGWDWDDTWTMDKGHSYSRGWDIAECAEWHSGGVDFSGLDTALQAIVGGELRNHKQHKKVKTARRMDNWELGRCVHTLEQVVSSMRSAAEGGDDLHLPDLQQVLATLKGMHETADVVKEQASGPESSGDVRDGLSVTLQRADQLMQEGQQCLEGSEEGLVLAADRSVGVAVGLLRRAVAVKPTSLVAVGMLANALLLRGQLKLRAVKLTEMSDGSELEELRQGCEQLVVEAGRMYRRALWINTKDFRALHNWGVALACRGELVVASLPEPQEEGSLELADKLYLAAIDKFQALVGVDRDHAAPALVNWAAAVRNRSRLRNVTRTQRQHLLLQAQRLLQDAATLDPHLSAEAAEEILEAQSPR